MGSESPWRSLHPASLAVNLMPQAWRVLKGFWPVILFSLINQQKQSTGGSAGDFVVFLLFVLLSVFNTVVHFMTLLLLALSEGLGARPRPAAEEEA